MSEYAEFIDVDDESMTYVMDYAQYAQVGQCHNLGDEVRKLRDEVAHLRRTVAALEGGIEYWRGQYMLLSGQVNRLFCLYGWGGDPLLMQGDKLARVRDDIVSLRKRVHYFKKASKMQGW